MIIYGLTDTILIYTYICIRYVICIVNDNNKASCLLCGGGAAPCRGDQDQESVAAALHARPGHELAPRSPLLELRRTGRRGPATAALK